MVGVFIRGDADGRLHRAQADIWSVLAEVVEQAWALWEMLVLAKPLLVLAPSPGAPPGPPVHIVEDF